MSFDLEKIGPMLKAGREEKGLTLDDVSRALFIRKSIMGGIESGNWDVLPHVVYVKGYVTQYASFLDMAQLIQLEIGSEEKVLPQVRQDVVMSKKGLWGTWEPNKKIIGTVTMAAVVIAFLIFQNVERPVPVAPTYGTVNAGYQGVSKGAIDSQGEKLVLETKKLVIACRERTWVRVMIDGSEKKEFMLNPEEVVMFNAKETFDLLIGNAGGVKVFYNGNDTGFTGNNGEVKRINLS